MCNLLGRKHTFTAITYKLIMDLTGEFAPNAKLAPLNGEKLLCFLHKIYAGYRSDVAYHNDLHGVDVAQMMFVMIKQGNLREIA